MPSGMMDYGLLSNITRLFTPFPPALLTSMLDAGAHPLRCNGGTDLTALSKEAVISSF